jgi:hypothetical protein
MASVTVTLIIAAFLSGAVIAVFVMLVAGIHAGDRPRRLPAAPRDHLESLTRSMLGGGVRASHPGSEHDRETD